MFKICIKNEVCVLKYQQWYQRFNCTRLAVVAVVQALLGSDNNPWLLFSDDSSVKERGTLGYLLK